MPRANRPRLGASVPPPTLLRRRRSWPAHRVASQLFGLLLFACSVAQARPLRAQSCVGDCNGNLRVTLNELVLGTTIALGIRPLSDCLPFDSNHDSALSISELTAAVAAGLVSCPGTIVGDRNLPPPG